MQILHAQKIDAERDCEVAFLNIFLLSDAPSEIFVNVNDISVICRKLTREKVTRGANFHREHINANVHFSFS